MTKMQRLNKNINNYLFDHQILKHSIDYTWGIIIAAISAFAFAFGFECFVSRPDSTFVTGGISGLCQNIYLIFGLCGLNLSNALNLDKNSIILIMYVIINIPFITFGFKKVGVRFSILTLINVILSFAFTRILNIEVIHENFIKPIAQNSFIVDNMLARVLLGGICLGFSSAIAFKGYFSAGGIDIASYYFSLRKSNNTGKYSLYLNGFVVILYTILSIFQTPSQWSNSIILLTFSCLYIAVTSIIIDLINVRNKKYQLQIITNNKDLVNILMANFPHGMTLVGAVGAYTKENKTMIFMTISSLELKKVIKVINSVDKRAFVDVYGLVSVHGNFFIKPIE